MVKINLYDVYGVFIKSKNVEITDIKEDDWGLSLSVEDKEKIKEKKGHHYILHSIISPELKKI